MCTLHYNKHNEPINNNKLINKQNKHESKPITNTNAKHPNESTTTNQSKLQKQYHKHTNTNYPSNSRNIRHNGSIDTINASSINLSKLQHSIERNQRRKSHPNKIIPQVQIRTIKE
jgi:hypothetical protein